MISCHDFGAEVVAWRYDAMGVANLHNDREGGFMAQPKSEIGLNLYKDTLDIVKTRMKGEDVYLVSWN